MFKNLLNRLLPAQASPAAAPGPAPAAAPEDVARADALIAEGDRHEEAGDLQQAEALYRAAVAAAPGHARTHLNLGVLLAARGDEDGAIAAYERVLAIDPFHPFGNYNHGRLAFLRGDLAKAEALLAQALHAKPEFPQALIVQSGVLEALGKPEQAIEALQAALRLQPADADACFNLALILQRAGRAEEAEAVLAQALRARPEFPQALIVQSEVLEALGKPEQAIEALQAALRLQPADAGAWFNLALIFQRTGRAEEAEDAVRHALEREPDNPAGLELLARALRDQGFAQEALVSMRKVVQGDPTAWPHRSMELLIMNFVDGVPADELFRRHLEFGADLERAVPVRFEHRRDRGDPTRRLRVGYLSADYLLHPVTLFLVPVLEHHDRSQVEVFCYSFTPRQDAMTDCVRAATEHWRDVAPMTDAEIADTIHSDGIDVLVDLMGHTGHPRLGVFCQRPAPVQVAWLGYLNTTGLTRMDFRLSDVRSDPPATSQPVHTERLFPLPASQWCYRPMAEQAIPAEAPLERNGHVTFGSFNSAMKITPAACRRWAQVMLRVPGSRLLIVDISAERKRAAIRREIASLGVAGDRVEFMPRVPLGEYLGLYNAVDMTFDTFPYGGGTTTFDSLWMGVPVVAALGETPVSRSAASILMALGLEDWIAPSVGDFVELAVARASDREALLSLRRTLRPRMQDSLLTELPRYTRDLEAAYRAMWLEKTG